MQPFQRNPNESTLSHSSSSSSSSPFFLKRPALTTDLASKLIPIDVNLHTKKNAEEHSTHHYDIPGLVLRRGQPFVFSLTFNRDYNPEENQLFVRLAIGSNSLISKRTQIRILVDGPSSESKWSAKTISLEEKTDQEKKNRVSLQISSPPDAIIGRYSLLIEVRPVKKDIKTPYHPSDLKLFLFEVNLYFLFNPWQKDDTCALSSSKEIDEYVMNEHGEIYLGSADKPQSIPWYYGQFEGAALATALDLLDRAHLPQQNRIDPAVILRLIASKICSNPGSNTGIFPSSFANRTRLASTHSYTSSSAILKEYVTSNGHSISGGSGTNWQHAAVLCSLARALGIPCRVVTVYNQGCRTDGSDSYDIHWDLKQRPLKHLNMDSICSAHVWNECWMRRDDLSIKEQGWQVIDSTPIQMCDGVRRIGPCAVSMLKQGQLGYRWDSSFIHSSIHGHQSHWKVYPDGNMELLDIEEDKVGKKIVTKSLAKNNEPEDITEQYKSIKAVTETKPTKQDVNIHLKVPEEIRFGDEITLELNGENKSDHKRTILTALTVCVLNRTDQRVITCYNLPPVSLKLEEQKSDKLSLRIRPAQYVHHGKPEDITVQYYIHAQVQETDQIFTRLDHIVFIQDDLVKLTLDEDVVEIGRTVFLKVEVINPMANPLNNGRIHINGLGINQALHVRPFLAPRESLLLHLKLYPTRVGTSRLYVTFTSDEMSSSTQTVPIEIIREPIKAPTKVQTTEAKKEEEEEPLTKQVSSSTPIGDTTKQEKDVTADSSAKSESSASDHVDSTTENKNPMVHGSTLSVDSLDASNDKKRLSSDSNTST